MKTKEGRPRVERTYKTMYTYTCPVRGVVTEEVEVQVFTRASAPESNYSDPDLLALIGSTGENLDDEGFQEEILN